MTISPERQEWLRDFARAHKDDYPRKRYAELAGVGVDKWYRLLHEVGAEIRISHTTDMKNVEIVKREIGNLTYPEIAEAYGISVYTVRNIAHRCGLVQPPHIVERTKQRRREALAKGLRTVMERSCEMRKKQGESLKRLYKQEERRVMYGLRRKTKLHLRKMPKFKYKVKWYLVNKYGYIETTKPYVVWYDEGTDRRLNTRYDEAYYSERYGLKFERAED